MSYTIEIRNVAALSSNALSVSLAVTKPGLSQAQIDNYVNGVSIGPEPAGTAIYVTAPDGMGLDNSGLMSLLASLSASSFSAAVATEIQPETSSGTNDGAVEWVLDNFQLNFQDPSYQSVDWTAYMSSSSAVDIKLSWSDDVGDYPNFPVVAGSPMSNPVLPADGPTNSAGTDVDLDSLSIPAPSAVVEWSQNDGSAETMFFEVRIDPNGNESLLADLTAVQFQGTTAGQPFLVVLESWMSSDISNGGAIYLDLINDSNGNPLSPNLFDPDVSTGNLSFELLKDDPNTPGAFTSLDSGINPNGVVAATAEWGQPIDTLEGLVGRIEISMDSPAAGLGDGDEIVVSILGGYPAGEHDPTSITWYYEHPGGDVALVDGAGLFDSAQPDVIILDSNASEWSAVHAGGLYATFDDLDGATYTTPTVQIGDQIDGTEDYYVSIYSTSQYGAIKGSTIAHNKNDHMFVNPVYQWQVDDAASGNWLDVSGGTGETLVMPLDGTDGTTLYRLKVTHDYDITYSNELLQEEPIWSPVTTGQWFNGPDGSQLRHNRVVDDPASQIDLGEFLRARNDHLWDSVKGHHPQDVGYGGPDNFANSLGAFTQTAGGNAYVPAYTDFRTAAESLEQQIEFAISQGGSGTNWKHTVSGLQATQVVAGDWVQAGLREAVLFDRIQFLDGGNQYGMTFNASENPLRGTGPASGDMYILDGDLWVLSIDGSDLDSNTSVLALKGLYWPGGAGNDFYQGDSDASRRGHWLQMEADVFNGGVLGGNMKYVFRKIENFSPNFRSEIMRDLAEIRALLQTAPLTDAEAQIPDFMDPDESFTYYGGLASPLIGYDLAATDSQVNFGSGAYFDIRAKHELKMHDRLNDHLVAFTQAASAGTLTATSNITQSGDIYNAPASGPVLEIEYDGVDDTLADLIAAVEATGHFEVVVGAYGALDDTAVLPASIATADHDGAGAGIITLKDGTGFDGMKDVFQAIIDRQLVVRQEIADQADLIGDDDVYYPGPGGDRPSQGFMGDFSGCLSTADQFSFQDQFGNTMFQISAHDLLLEAEERILNADFEVDGLPGEDFHMFGPMGMQPLNQAYIRVGSGQDEYSLNLGVSSFWNISNVPAIVNFAAGSTLGATYDSATRMLNITLSSSSTIDDVVNAIDAVGVQGLSVSHWTDGTSAFDSSMIGTGSGQIASQYVVFPNVIDLSDLTSDAVKTTVFEPSFYLLGGGDGMRRIFVNGILTMVREADGSWMSAASTIVHRGSRVVIERSGDYSS